MRDGERIDVLLPGIGFVGVCQVKGDIATVDITIPELLAIINRWRDELLAGSEKPLSDVDIAYLENLGL